MNVAYTSLPTRGINEEKLAREREPHLNRTRTGVMYKKKGEGEIQKEK